MNRKKLLLWSLEDYDSQHGDRLMLSHLFLLKDSIVL